MQIPANARISRPHEQTPDQHARTTQPGLTRQACRHYATWPDLTRPACSHLHANVRAPHGRITYTPNREHACAQHTHTHPRDHGTQSGGTPTRTRALNTHTPVHVTTEHSPEAHKPARVYARHTLSPHAHRHTPCPTPAHQRTATCRRRREPMSRGGAAHIRLGWPDPSALSSDSWALTPRWWWPHGGGDSSPGGR